MPYCKSCHREISKFDKDICPYCGEKNPIDASYETMDITQHIDPLAKGYGLYKSKSHRRMIWLCATLGYFGVHDFYLGFKKRAFIELFSTIFVVAGAGCTLYFTGLLKNALAFIIPFLVVWLFYIAAALILRKNDSLKDSNGEFLR
jgi:hypothetical protein